MTLCGREIRPASICNSELFLTTSTAPVSVSTRTMAAGSAGLAAVMSTSFPEADHAAYRCVRQLDFAGLPVSVDDHQAAAGLSANNQGDAAVRQKGIRGLAEHPLRFA